VQEGDVKTKVVGKVGFARIFL